MLLLLRVWTLYYKECKEWTFLSRSRFLRQCSYPPIYYAVGYKVVTHSLYYDEICSSHFTFLLGCAMMSCCTMSKPVSALLDMTVDCIQLTPSMCITDVDMHLLNKPYVSVRILINPSCMIWYFLEFAVPKFYSYHLCLVIKGSCSTYLLYPYQVFSYRVMLTL